MDPKFEGRVHFMDNITLNSLTFDYGNNTKAIPINIVNKNSTTDITLAVNVDKLKTILGATLKLNKDTSRDSVSVRR